MTRERQDFDDDVEQSKWRVEDDLGDYGILCELPDGRRFIVAWELFSLEVATMIVEEHNKRVDNA